MHFEPADINRKENEWKDDTGMEVDKTNKSNDEKEPEIPRKNPILHFSKTK